jgi:hypothetical protein
LQREAAHLGDARVGALVWAVNAERVVGMHVGLDMSRLIFIELFFHMTLLACGLTLAAGLLRLARAADASQRI